MGSSVKKMQVNKFTLSFFGEMENEFQKFFFLDSLNNFRIAFLVVTFLYGAFGFLDSIKAIEHLKLFYIIRFAVIIPFLIIVFLLSFFNFFKKFWQLIIAFSFVLGGVGIIAMLLTIPNEISYYGGLMLVLFSGYFFIKLRFIFASICGWTLIVIYNLSSILYLDTNNPTFIAYNFFFISANIIGMFASYYIEYFYRYSYWLTKNLEKKSIELEDALQNEKTINELKTRFVATVSHEFRTPLSTILSSSELLQRYSEKWDQAKKELYFKKINSKVEHLTKLVEDVMLISRAEREVLKNNPLQLNFLEQIENYLDEYKLVMSDSHKIKVVSKSIVNSIYADKKLLHHIFSNIIGNAIKYSPNGGEINIEIDFLNECFVVEISDQGIGIPKEEIENIFDPFYRTKNSLDIGGTGLGLNVAKRAVDVLGGKIEIKKTSSNGTTISVTIPQITAK